MAERRALEQSELSGLGVVREEKLRPGRGRSPWRRTGVIFGLVAIVGYAASQARQPPPLEPDCANVRLVIDDSELRVGEALRFRFTGPADARFVLAVDAVGVRAQDGAVVVEPSAASREFRPVSRVLQPDNCAEAGLVGLGADVGERTVTLFRLDESGVGRAITSEQITVAGAP